MLSSLYGNSDSSLFGCAFVEQPGQRALITDQMTWRGERKCVWLNLLRKSQFLLVFQLNVMDVCMYVFIPKGPLCSCNAPNVEWLNLVSTYD